MVALYLWGNHKGCPYKTHDLNSYKSAKFLETLCAFAPLRPCVKNNSVQFIYLPVLTMPLLAFLDGPAEHLGRQHRATNNKNRPHPLGRC